MSHDVSRCLTMSHDVSQFHIPLLRSLGEDVTGRLSSKPLDLFCWDQIWTLRPMPADQNFIEFPYKPDELETIPLLADQPRRCQNLITIHLRYFTLNLIFFLAGSGSESKSDQNYHHHHHDDHLLHASWCYLSLSLPGNSSSPAVPLQNDLLHLLDLRIHQIIPHPFAEAGLHKGHDENQSCSAQILGLQWDSMGLKDTLLNITTIVLVLVLKTTRSRFGLAKTYLLVGLSHHPPQKKNKICNCVQKTAF